MNRVKAKFWGLDEFGSLNLWKIIRKSYKYFLLDTIIWFIVHTMPLFMGLLSKKAFDNLSSCDNLYFFFWIVGFCICLILLNIILIYIGAYIDLKYKNSIKKILYESIIASIIRSDYGLSEIKGEIIDCINTDIEVIVNTISYCIDTFGNACLSLMACIVMFQINRKLTFFLIIPVFVTVFISILSKKELVHLTEDNREIEKKISSDIYSFIASYEMIRILGEEENIIQKIKEYNKKKETIEIKKGKLCSIIKILNQVTGDFILAILLLLMVNPLRKKEMSMGDLTLFVFYSGYMIEFVSIYLSSCLTKLRQAEVSIANLNKFLTYKRSSENADDTKEEIIKKLLDNKISLIILLGENGSGKTYMSEAIFKKMCSEYNIALLSQSPTIFNLSVKENILLDSPYIKEKFNRAVHIAELQEEEFEDGFDSIVGVKGKKISGGQIFRIALARLVYVNPEYVIIDGGLNSVEPEKRVKIVSNMYELFGGKILITDHTGSSYGFINNKEIITLRRIV